MRRIMKKLRCLVKGHLWEPRKVGHWSRHVCICCGKRGMTHFVPVIAEKSARTKCEGHDDPEERCPRHPNDCICWQGRNPSPAENVVEEDALYTAMRAAWDAAKSRLAAVQQAGGLEGVYCNAFRRGWASAMASPSPKDHTVSRGSHE